MYLVIDIGGTAIKYCCMNRNGEIFNQKEFLTANIVSLEQFIKCLSDIYFSCENIEGIALACPGVIDSINGIVEKITAYPFLQGKSLTKLLSKACDNILVTIENDAKCAALAEVWQGNAKDCDDAIVIVFGTGIGGAVIKNKQIHHGAHRLAGEISTLIVDYRNGQFLTWSDLASTTALCKRVSDVLKIDKINGRQVFELVHDGNEAVIKVLDAFCNDIAIQLYNLQYMYDPDIICIGGGISKQKILLEKIQASITKIAMDSEQLLDLKVVSCKYYNQANLLGALYHFLMVNNLIF